MADYVGLESPNKFLFGCGMDLAMEGIYPRFTAFS